MEPKNDIRKKLRKALKNASEDHAEGGPTGCCTITAGEVVEHRGNITAERCIAIANLFGGSPNFQIGVNC